MYPTDQEDYGPDAMANFAPDIVAWIRANYEQAPDAMGLPMLVRRR
jgi:hypothetical protein